LGRRRPAAFGGATLAKECTRTADVGSRRFALCQHMQRTERETALEPENATPPSLEWTARTPERFALARDRDAEHDVEASEGSGEHESRARQRQEWDGEGASADRGYGVEQQPDTGQQVVEGQANESNGQQPGDRDAGEEAERKHASRAAEGEAGAASLDLHGDDSDAERPAWLRGARWRARLGAPVGG
jgi:hypothetical protein